MVRILIAILLAGMTLTGGVLADTLTWTGNGDYNNDGDWEDDDNWDIRAPLADGLDDVVITATKSMGNSGTDTRTITVNDPADVNSIGVPKTISETSSGYYATLTSFHSRYNVLRLEADLTVDVMDVEDRNFSFRLAAGVGLTVEGSGDFALGGLASDAPASLVIDGPDHLMRGEGADWSNFRGTITVKSPTLLGGYDRPSIYDDWEGLVPDVPGGNFFALQHTSELTIEQGAMLSCRIGDKLFLANPGSVLRFEGEGKNVDGDPLSDPDGAVCFYLEEWYAETSVVKAQVQLTGDALINIAHCEHLRIILDGDITGPGGGCTLTKKGVGTLQLNGDVGQDPNNRVNIHLTEGKLILAGGAGQVNGDITVDAGATLVCGAGQVNGTITSAPADWLQAGTWTGSGDGATWGDGDNWSEHLVPSGLAMIPASMGGTIQVNAPASLGALMAKGPATIEINAGMTINQMTLDNDNFTFDITGANTLTIDNAELSNIQNVTGPATANLIKTGIGRLAVKYKASWPFTGTFTVNQGMVGEYIWGNTPGGEHAYLKNCKLVIEDGGTYSLRGEGGNSVAADLTLDGTGMQTDPWALEGAEWNVNRGAIHHYINFAGQTETHSMPVHVTANGASINVSAGWYFYGPSNRLNIQYTGDIDGPGALTKIGDCVLSLHGNASNVNGAGDSFIVAEGALKVDGTISGGDVTVNAPVGEPGWWAGWWGSFENFDGFQPSVSGTGTIDHELILQNGSWLSPRTGMPNPYALFPSDLTAGDATVNACTWEVDINAIPSEGVAGTNWNLLTVTSSGTGGTGNLALSAAAENPIMVKIVSLDANNDPGEVPNFQNDTSYTWVIASADSVTGGSDPSVFAVETTDFLNNTGSGVFTVAVVGTELQLTFDPAGPTVESDVTGDSRITILDLLGVRNHLHQDVNTGNNAKYDVNGDGQINVLDLIYVRNHLGI